MDCTLSYKLWHIIECKQILSSFECWNIILMSRTMKVIHILIRYWFLKRLYLLGKTKWRGHVKWSKKHGTNLSTKTCLPGANVGTKSSLPGTKLSTKTYLPGTNINYQKLSEFWGRKIMFWFFLCSFLSYNLPISYTRIPLLATLYIAEHFFKLE